MRGSARFGRIGLGGARCESAFVAARGRARAIGGLAWIGWSRTSDMNATHTLVRIADRLNAPGADSVAEVLHEMGRRARRAARRLATASAEEKSGALRA